MKAGSAMPSPAPSDATDLAAILERVRLCRACRGLPLGPRPVLQADRRARILIAGQAPGRMAHETGVPFNDPSGDRLRAWMGIDRNTFYDSRNIAILPMGFCYPGRGQGGDLPPRPECAATWRDLLVDGLSNVELTLVIGRYALDWHVGGETTRSVTKAVRDWRAAWPRLLPLPHPSPRNNLWLKRNPWFESSVLPVLKVRVEEILTNTV